MVDINKFFKQAQSMTKTMQDMQEQMANCEYSGKAGGGLVEIIMTGNGKARKATIDPSLCLKEEVEILEDLVVAAFNDAKNKIDQASKESLSGALGGLNLPPGFKLPF